MPIYRVHADRYTIVGNDILESTELSWKAKGLMAYMLGRPDNWEFSEKALYSLFPDGQTSTRSGIKELEDAGYLYRQRVRDGGKVAGCIWHVFQSRMTKDEIHDLVFQTGQTPTGETTNNKLLNIEITKGEITEVPIVDDKSAEIQEIVAYLNESTGKHFSPKTPKTIKFIRGRLSEGYTVDDFKRVIDNKVAKWKGDPYWSSYLQPSTLFAQSHFDEYLNETPAHSNQNGGDVDFSAYSL